RDRRMNGSFLATLLSDREQHRVVNRVHLAVRPNRRRRVRFAETAGEQDSFAERVRRQIPSIQVPVFAVPAQPAAAKSAHAESIKPARSDRRWRIEIPFTYPKRP